MDSIPALAAVHAVGVYGGTVPTDGDRAFGGPRLGTVDVTVAVRDHPVLLVLTAYEPVHWRIGIAPGVQLVQVLAFGYHAPMVSGVPAGIPVATQSYDHDRTWIPLTGPRGDHIMAFADQIRAVTGRTVRTVQFASPGRGFSVDGVSSLPLQALPPPGVPPHILSTRSTGSYGGLASGPEPGERYVSADRPTVMYCCAGAFSFVPARKAYSTGKYYVEFTLRLRPGAPASDVYTNVGIASESAWSFRPNADGAYAYPVMALEAPGRLKDGDIVGLALDLDAARFSSHVNGVWRTGRPPQGGVAIAPGRAYRAVVAVSAPPAPARTSDAWTANFGHPAFAFPAPPGFQPYAGSAPDR